MKTTLIRIFLISMGFFGAMQTSSKAQEQVAGEVDLHPAGWWDGAGMTGDWCGQRTVLADQGIEFLGGYTVDVFGNTTGGQGRGARYAGLLDFGVDVDLEKAIGWEGASVSTTWLWLSGRDISEDLVGNFLTISNIAGFNTLRLFELWFEQKFAGDLVSVRLGQLAADSEFIISDYGSLFINGTFGWPAFVYRNLPEGGPGYPMGTPGARVAIQPVHWFTFLTAVFQGNVFAQDVNRHGFRYRLDGSTGFTFVNEAQVRWNQEQEEARLPGQFKGGVWFQSGSLADPLTDSTSSGNVGVYAILDQMVFREDPVWSLHTRSSKGSPAGGKGFVEASEQKSDQGLGVFARVALNPSDRNIVNFYFDTGLSYKGLLPCRGEDTMGVGFGYAQVSSGAKTSLVADGGSPAGAEMVLEATYQAQITNWMSLQPDLQYIIQPNADRDLNNAFLIGLRTAIVF